MNIHAASPSDEGLDAQDAQQNLARRLATCRAMIREVRIVERIFGKRLAGNPELTMLLDLYLAEHEARETCLWEACNATTIPTSTAHRKLSQLVKRGLIERTEPSKDHRRIALRLASATAAALDELMDRLADPSNAGREP